MDEKQIVKWPTTKFKNGTVQHTDDFIVQERPLTIVINGEEFATLVCSPEDLRHLVIGFLASEGAIRTYQDIQDITFNESSGFAYVQLKKRPEKLPDTTKRLIGSCCGKSRQIYFQVDAKTARTITRAPQITAADCIRLMDDLQQRSEVFSQTGGVHNAGIVSDGKVLIMQTDIGRHNALDKLYGYMLEHGLAPHELSIVFSGRLSSEVILKTAKMGVGIILSKSPPTNLALELATDLNITVAGFIRGGRMNIYTYPERIVEKC